MKIQSFEYMQAAYDHTERGIDPDDLEDRTKLLSGHTRSVIVEGDFMEFDHLHKWIDSSIAPNRVKAIYYGKTAYDFGFAEFFVAEKSQEEKIRQAIPNMYTVYPNANPAPVICKSDGYNHTVPYHPENREAIIFPADTHSKH